MNVYQYQATATEYLGCNLAVDFETFGLGAVACTAMIFTGSMVGGAVGSSIANFTVKQIYKNAFKTTNNS